LSDALVSTRFRMILLLMAAVAALAAGVAVADGTGIAVSQRIDRHETPFEQPVQMEIALSWNGPQSAYLFDKPLRPDLERLKVREFSSSISSTGSGLDERSVKVYRFTLVPTSAGTGRVDPVAISYVSWPDSTPGELYTEAMSILIADPVPPPKPGEIGVIAWIGIGFGGMMLVGLIILIAKNRRDEPVNPFLTPRQEFLERLTALKSEAGSDFKKFQSGLYKLLVEFVRDEYKVTIDEASEGLFAEKLAQTSLTEDRQKVVEGWLRSAHRDKFRPVSAAPGDAIRLESEVRTFFEKL